MVTGQTLYEEYFTGGNMQLDWHPWFTDSAGFGDSMGVVNDPTTPGGDSWAGRISNEYMGVAGLTYAGESWLVDYSIEAWIFTRVTAGMGPYNGIAVRMDPATRYYYRLVSDFDADARLRLGLVGSGGYPVVLRDWTAGEIPGGIPASSSWHKLGLRVKADSIWAYFDEIMLPGCPIVNDSVSQGYFGVYAFDMLDTASTICDNIVITEVNGVSEYGQTSIAHVSVTPNPFVSSVRITFTDELGSPGELTVRDVTGRTVRHLPLMQDGQHASALWDGKNDSAELVAPGIYFVSHKNAVTKIVKLR
jgi:hypothetical protein